MSTTMQAMVLKAAGSPLRLTELPIPEPSPRQLRLRVLACGVCRTDLHIFDGELTEPKLPLVPGHEIVGRVEALGSEVEGFAIGDRVGVPWLGFTDGTCPYCRNDQENLCDGARFTGYQIDGGYASHTVADARYCFHLPEGYSDAEAAPLLCAGLIGYRSLKMTGDAARLGIYGFGAAAHIVAQVARHQGREIFAFTRAGDTRAQDFARALGAAWAGGSDDMPPETARRRHHLRPSWSLGAGGAEGLTQRRRRSVRRHPYERHPFLSLRDSVGRAGGAFRRQPHAGGCARVPGACPSGRRQNDGGADASPRGQRGACPLASGRTDRRGGAYSVEL